MGDAVRRMQKHLQELSRDHLTSVEDRHHANLGWLQIEFQQLCKQIEVEVRVELTRPPRMSFSKPNAALLPAPRDADKPAHNPSTSSASVAEANEPATSSTKSKARVLPSPVNVPTARLLFDAIEKEASPRASKKRRLEETKKGNEKEGVVSKKQSTIGREIIDVDAESDVEVVGVLPPVHKRMVKRTVKRTRKVLKPKTIIKTEKKFVKEEKPILPQVDVGVLKVVDLKAELKKRGLRQVGVKAVLAMRLKEALDAEDAAQAKEDDDKGTWVTEEIVEEVMEEVEEEYEEVIEEEEATGGFSTSVVGDAAMVVEEERTIVHVEGILNDFENDPVREVKCDTVQDASTDNTTKSTETMTKEAERMSIEDVNIPAVTEQMPVIQPNTRAQSSQVKSSLVSTSQPSPKESMSDIVGPMAVDEIVRESADGFMSPDGKKQSVKVNSARKSSGKKVQPRLTTARLDAIVEAEPNTAKVPAVPSSRKTPSGDESEASALVFQRSGQAKHALDVSSAEKAAVDKRCEPAPRSSVQAQNVEPSQERDVRRMNAVAATQTDKSVELTTTEKQASNPAMSDIKPLVTAPIQGAQKAPAVLKEAMTPSRELMERVKSLASSSRSSSTSSFTAARRYTGSISYVEDSQPDQSPHRSSIVTDFSSQSTRASSTSQLEIESLAKAKTPDSTVSIPPPSERIAHSEPRTSVAKHHVENEADRKRREQQENIQREAQRIRLAMKQSAKKRFEESKTSTLFWKRDVGRAETKMPTSVEVHRNESISTSPLSIPNAVDSVTSLPNRTVSKQEPTNEEKVTTASIADESRHIVASKAPATAPAASGSERFKSLAPGSQSSVSASIANKETEKRVVPTRKRSSIVLDSSASTLYPSKKRNSNPRSKDVEPVVKRTSLTKTTSPAETLRKRVSTERAPTTTDAPKRKRSSVSRDKPAEDKRRSNTSAQADQRGAQAQSAFGVAAPQKSSKPTSRLGASSSTAATRRESVSSTISSSSNISVSEVRSKPARSVLSGGAVRKPANLVSGLHSFTSLLEKDAANLSSSQGSNASASSRQPPNVSALKLAERSRLNEQKINLEKAKRKQALAKKYEEQRKADEDKRKKIAELKEKATREARLNHAQAAEKKRELELAKKQQQRPQQVRPGAEKKKGAGSDRDQSAVSKPAVPVSRVAGATTSVASSQSGKSAAKAHTQENKEVTTYAMSENEESSGSEDEKDTERNSKNIPRWAQREHLERTLRIQFGPNAVDPTPSIFPDFVDSCDLEAIFEPTDVRKKKRFQRRTSSGNWLGDRPTAREKAVYKKDMGFSR